MRPALLGLLVAGGCGFEVPGSGSTSSDGRLLDGTVDARPDTPPGLTCFGVGLATVCVPQLPTADLQVVTPTQFSTNAGCDAVSGTHVDDVCVRVFRTIEIGSTLRVTGDKPLVLVATSTALIAGTLDVSSQRNPLARGAGAAAVCPVGALATGKGGGAGGSFGGIGGRGGNAGGGTAGQGMPAPTSVVGGCPGAHGDNTAQGGAGGFGGGAAYVIAGTSIQVTGFINASGAAGTNAIGNNDHGGGGGGSGGLIGLDAPSVSLSGVLMANGAGGGEGDHDSGSANPGSEPTQATVLVGAPGGTGGNASSGDGGPGSAAAGLDGGPGLGGSNAAGGGGGGGAAGVIKIFSPSSSQLGVASPPPS